MPQINVLLINDSFPPEIDGVANAVTNYARIISSRFGNATVVTPDVPNADDTQFPFSVLRYPSIDMTKLLGYYAGLPFSAQLVQRLTDSRYDIIHSHCPITSTLLARSLREILGIPLVMTYHTKFDVEIANVFRTRLLQKEAARLLTANISACDEVWTVSRGAGENLRSLGFEGDYTVMPNGVDLPCERASDAQIRELKQQYRLPDGVPVFLFIGRIMWYKGLRIILDALAQLQKQQDFRMLFVGNGSDRDACMAYRDELGLSEKVIFAESVQSRNRIRVFYSAADLFLFPSTFDTNGLVVREAAACALASVLIRGSCAAEDIREDENGFLIEENAASMADKLLYLCRNPEKMKAVGQNAQNQIYISWDDAVTLADARYRKVIENYHSGKYPARIKPSDEAFRAVANYLEVMANIREHLEELQERLL